MRRFIAFGFALGTLASVSAAFAADLAERRSFVDMDRPVSDRLRVAVTIDALTLKGERCRRDPDCIAPRVLPILPDSRRVTFVDVTIPVDPRFEDRYPH